MKWDLGEATALLDGFLMALMQGVHPSYDEALGVSLHLYSLEELHEQHITAIEAKSGLRALQLHTLVDNLISLPAKMVKVMSHCGATRVAIAGAKTIEDRYWEQDGLLWEDAGNEVYGRAFDFLLPEYSSWYNNEKKGDYLEALLATCFLVLHNPLYANHRRYLTCLREDLETVIEAVSTGPLPSGLDDFLLEVPPVRAFLPFRMPAEYEPANLYASRFPEADFCTVG